MSTEITRVNPLNLNAGKGSEEDKAIKTAKNAKANRSSKPKDT